MSDTSSIHQQSFDFFFYGTLVVPAILVRVLGHRCENLTFQDAILPEYTRHCVKNEDYPAVISRAQAEQLSISVESTQPEGHSTRGTLVKGLTYKDVHALDIFEGNQYNRRVLPVKVLSEPANINQLPKGLSDPNTRSLVGNTANDSGNSPSSTKIAHAWVYVWTANLTDLEPKIWSFQQFMSEKASLWTGLDTTEFDEVERARAIATLPEGENSADHPEAEIQGKTVAGFEDFGHNMLKYWGFDRSYVNLNHGSYGSPPKPVIEAMKVLSRQIESNPDRFMRRSWLPLLTEVRSGVAEIINADLDEVVIVPNATHGINTILMNMNWEDGDIIVMYSTTYGAIAQTLKYVADRHPKVNLEIVDVTFPCPHSEVVSKTEDMLEKYNEPIKLTSASSEIPKPVAKNAKDRVKMVVVDSISSNPGIVFPWEDIVGICKKYGVFSLVDAAHSIGQLPVDVKKADADFWISNCHKWLMSHRGGSVMYIPKRNQHLGIDRPWSFEHQYEWTGTTDWLPFMSITAAIQFRKSIGGEKRITDYCHSLAVQGGKRLLKRWGTSVMDNLEWNLTANMVNVALPEFPQPKNLEEQFKQLKYFEDGLFEANVFAPAFRHADKWWARFSAQVWNELEDFDKVASVFDKLCEGIRQGKHLQQEVAETETLHRAADMPSYDE